MFNNDDIRFISFQLLYNPIISGNLLMIDLFNSYLRCRDTNRNKKKTRKSSFVGFNENIYHLFLKISKRKKCFFPIISVKSLF